MKIAVLNGSPKAQELSVTMHYIKYIQKKFPQHEFKILNISKNIQNIERNENIFKEIIDDVQYSDIILWVSPVFIMLIPFQIKRFIELIYENRKEATFANKYTAALTSSIHFYDHTAHNYLNAICDDLNMKYIGSFSAEMDDLLRKKERERLINFANYVFESAQNKIFIAKRHNAIAYKEMKYISNNETERINTKDKKIIIISDFWNVNSNLINMITRFKNCFSNAIEIIILDAIDIKGGCLSCFQCGFDNICVYNNKDGFTKFYNTKVKNADILILAGTIKDRYLSSKWKLFFDRSFFNTHIPTLVGKQVGFIISGPLKQIPNLREILEAYIEWQQANLVDIITDEFESSSEIDQSLENLAKHLVSFSDMNYVKSPTFLGVGGRRILRDYIWGKFRFVMQADHRFYKKYHLYDFPQNDTKMRMVNITMTPLMKISRFRKRFMGRIHEEMIKEHQKILKKDDQSI